MAVFSQNWFEFHAQKNFEKLLEVVDFTHPINYLEIGCYEGNCHKWIWDKALSKNSESRSTVIDPFEVSKTHSNAYGNFTNNLKQYLDKITIQKGFSDDILPILKKNSYDIIYIDGDHSAEAAFKDGVNSFPLLKVGGIMIFDDYLWTKLGNNGDDIGNYNSPFTGINCFLHEYKNKVKILDNFVPPIKQVTVDMLLQNKNNFRDLYNYQILLQKISN